MPTATTIPARDLAATADRHLRAAGDNVEAEQLAALRTLPLDFLRCRGDGHQWQIQRGYGVTITNPKTGNTHTEVNWAWAARVCTRCGAEVEKHYDQYYLPLRGNRSGYPEDYLFKGLGRVPPRLARKVLWETEVPRKSTKRQSNKATKR